MLKLELEDFLLFYLVIFGHFSFIASVHKVIVVLQDIPRHILFWEDKNEALGLCLGL